MRTRSSWIASGLKIEEFLVRRLQTQLRFEPGQISSPRHARVFTRQRHIRVHKPVGESPSFAVRLDSEKHVEFSLRSPYGGDPGCVKRKNAKKGLGGAGVSDDEEEDKINTSRDRRIV